MRQKLKPLTLLPALLMLCLIFGFSAQNGEHSSGLSEKATRQIIFATDHFFQKNWTEHRKDRLVRQYNFYIRKAAHMTEYCILALTVMLPLCIYKVRGRRMVLLTLGICLAVAGSDEFHQTLVSGRVGTPADVGIDMIGVSVGTAAAVFFLRKKQLFPAK